MESLGGYGQAQIIQRHLAPPLPIAVYVESDGGAVTKHVFPRRASTSHSSVSPAEVSIDSPHLTYHLNWQAPSRRGTVLVHGDMVKDKKSVLPGGSHPLWSTRQRSRPEFKPRWLVVKTFKSCFRRKRRNLYGRHGPSTDHEGGQLWPQEGPKLAIELCSSGTKNNQSLGEAEPFNVRIQADNRRVLRRRNPNNQSFSTTAAEWTVVRSDVLSRRRQIAKLERELLGVRERKECSAHRGSVGM